MRAKIQLKISPQTGKNKGLDASGAKSPSALPQTARKARSFVNWRAIVFQFGHPSQKNGAVYSLF